MQMLDATILNTAIPTIARSFNSHPLQLHSLVTAYMLTVCVLIPASGWISDKLGSRRTFLFAISVFSAGSLLCALSTSVAMMTACRVIQGIGGAFLMPVGRLVVLRSYPRSMFVNVLNIVTIPALLGPLLGPVLGGHHRPVRLLALDLPDQHSGGHRGPVATWKLMPDLKAVREQKFDWAASSSSPPPPCWSPWASPPQEAQPTRRAWPCSCPPEACSSSCTGCWRSVQRRPSSAPPCSASGTSPSASPATSSAAWGEAACRT